MLFVQRELFFVIVLHIFYLLLPCFKFGKTIQNFVVFTNNDFYIFLYFVTSFLYITFFSVGDILYFRQMEIIMVD